MPPTQDQNTYHDWRKLECTEESLMAACISAYSFRGFGQAENRPQIHQQAADHDRATELHQATGPRARGCFARFGQKHEKKDEEEQEGENLIHETGEQDIIGRVRRLVIAFGNTDQSRPNNLGDGSDNITRDEENEDELLLQAERTQILAEGINQRRKDCVDGG